MLNLHLYYLLKNQADFYIEKVIPVVQLMLNYRNKSN